jgi:predicted TIM-barrel fold metal-dependent hydrolase
LEDLHAVRSGGQGILLDDEVGIRFIEKARALGIRNIAVHKGLPFGPKSYEHSTCADVGRAAKRFPDVNFLIYHSGFVAEKKEGPYDPKRTDGIDALVTSLQENNVKPGANVYAELGSTWRFLMRDPDSAAHALGKLFKACGEDNVLWGTDSIWYGSPQDQIQAFRTFQIAPELRAKHGYPEITPALRAKVFGLNAVKIYPVPRTSSTSTWRRTAWACPGRVRRESRSRRSSPMVRGHVANSSRCWAKFRGRQALRR